MGQNSKIITVFSLKTVLFAGRGERTGRRIFRGKRKGPDQRGKVRLENEKEIMFSKERCEPL
jgi:hypothetical protein